MNSRIRSTAALLLLVAISACGGSTDGLETRVATPEARPLGRQYPTFNAATATLPALSPAAPSGSIRLSDALAEALLRSPELAAFSWEMRAAEARAITAGARPNPELSGEVENFAGRSDNRGFRSAEFTLQLSQLVELGGKRAKRLRVAQLERELAGWDYEAKRLDVITATAQAFVEVLAAQRRTDLAARSLELAERIADAVRKRVRVGTETPIEEQRTAVTLANATTEVERARSELLRARLALAAAWGGEAPSFDRAEGEFETVRKVPPLSLLVGAVLQNPDLARFVAEIEHKRAALQLALSRRTPDLTVSAGVRRFSDTDESALVGGFSMPLPLFNTNAGGIAEARANLHQTKERRRGMEANAMARLAQAHEALSAAHREVELLSDDVVPAAESAFGAAQQAYREGKFGLLRVLDTQKELIEAQGRLLEAFAEYHKRSAELERLIGAPLDAAAQQD